MSEDVYFKPGERSPIEYRSMALSTRLASGPYMLRDQNASTGGNFPAGKVNS